MRRDTGDRRIAREVDSEVRFHLESRIEDLLAEGLSESAARSQAIAEFGDVDVVRAELASIDARRTAWRRRRIAFELARTELRRALRTLTRERGFSGTALLTLALGMATVIALFTLLDAVVLRPLPYPEPDRLVRLSSTVPGVGPDTRWALAKGEFLHFRAEARNFESLGLYRTRSVVAGSESGAERAVAVQVEPGVAAVLGIRLLHGRFVQTADNLDPSSPVVVLSHGYFERRFGGDATIVGRTIRVDGSVREVIGVLGPEARLPEEIAASQSVDLWLPLFLDPAEPAQNSHLYPSIGRLRRGVSVKAARAELSRLTEGLPESLPSAYSEGFMERSGFRTVVEPLRSFVLGETSRTLWILLAAVGLVLFIALANVMNLLLVRVEARRRDSAVRTALGAGRAHQFASGAAESAWLSLAAGVFGFALAALSVRAVVLIAPAGFPRLTDAAPNWHSVLLASALTILSATLLASVQLVRGRVDVSLLRGEGRGNTESRRGRFSRACLVVTQFTLALMLLAAAGLLVRSFLHLKRVEPGFEPAGVFAISVHLPSTARYDDFASAGAFYRELEERVAALSGVEGVGLTEYLPFSGGIGCTALHATDAAQQNDPRLQCLPVFTVSPGWFSTTGIDVEGNTPDWAAVQGGVAGAIVSRALAERFWPNGDAIGREVRPNNGNGPFYRVAGVAEDVLDGLDRAPLEAVYFPIVPNPRALVDTSPPHNVSLVVRAPEQGTQLVPAIRSILADLDSDVAVGAINEMEDLVARSMARTSYSASLLLVAALLSILLSAVGIYGVVSYAVRQRQAEIGLRMALGARAEQVGGMVVAQSLRLAGVGVAIGLAGAFAVGRLLRSQLVGVEPADPLVITGASLVLLVAALIASALPARHAARLDPVSTLQMR